MRPYQCEPFSEDRSSTWDSRSRRCRSTCSRRSASARYSAYIRSSLPGLDALRVVGAGRCYLPLVALLPAERSSGSLGGLRLLVDRLRRIDQRRQRRHGVPQFTRVELGMFHHHLERLEIDMVIYIQGRCEEPVDLRVTFRQVSVHRLHLGQA